MEKPAIRKILEALSKGKLSVDEALERLAHSYESVEFATLDLGRHLRTGIDEVILCEGKTCDEVVSIARVIYKRTNRLLATRATPDVYSVMKEEIPEACYHERARVIVVGRHRRRARGRIAVVTAGTSDIGVAEEAAITAEFFGNPVDRVYDVGVAGLHRLLGHLEKLKRASVTIVVAGMEGALPSVVGGLIGGPIIAVPTSVGYGAGFQGLAPLLAMLSSCAPGVTVVNIDNGFGAAVAATLINLKRG